MEEEINVERENIIIGGEGTKNYNALNNKPKINGVELSGNKTNEDLNIQDKLINGQNIKTINNQPILGSGNIIIESGSEGTLNYNDLENKPKINGSDLSGNKTSTDLGLQEKLSSGTNIKTINGTSILGSGNLVIESGEDGLSSVEHDDTMTGAGTNASPLKVDTTKIAQKSDIPDTSEFITKSVNDLTNYTKTSDLGSLATKSTVNYETEVTNKPTIPSQVTEATVSGWGFTKNTGTYSKPSGGIPKSDLASAVQTSLSKADTALQSYTEQYTGTITGITMNGSSKGTSGVVDLGTVITAHQSIKTINSTSLVGTGDVNVQPTLVSGTNIKTINNTSLLGSGDISISGGATNYVCSNFDTTETITVGSYVMYNDVLYVCTTQHTGAWNASDFSIVNLNIGDLVCNVDESSFIPHYVGGVE